MKVKLSVLIEIMWTECLDFTQTGIEHHSAYAKLHLEIQGQGHSV